MATLLENANRIKTSKEGIKEKVNQDFTIITDEKIDEYPNLINNAINEYKEYIPRVREGSEIVVADGTDRKILEFNLLGKSTQNGTPTPDNPQEISSISGNVVVNVTGEQSQLNSTNIDLQGNELCSIGDVKDELVIENGRAKIVKKIGKIVLNGNEKLSFNNNPGVADLNLIDLMINDMLITNWGYGLSNYFLRGTTKVKNVIRYGANDNRIWIYVDENDFPNINTFKDWLSTHNTEIYYELATPEEIELEGTYDIELSSGTNNITNSTSTDMKVNYYKKWNI